jgi:hypothetical protein
MPRGSGWSVPVCARIVIVLRLSLSPIRVMGSSNSVASMRRSLTGGTGPASWMLSLWVVSR